MAGVTMKRIILVICLVFSLSSCNLDWIMDGDFVKEGLDEFHPAISSLALAEHVTFDLTKDNRDTILNRYEYESGFFRFYYHYDWKDNGLAHEDLLLSITYSESIFTTVVNHIKTCPGFIEDLSWNYASYMCFLNKTEDLHSNRAITDYYLDATHKEIKWINFVAISEANRTICFLGLVHKYDDDTGYRFKDWSELFENIFGFYSWN